MFRNSTTWRCWNEIKILYKVKYGIQNVNKSHRGKGLKNLLNLSFTLLQLALVSFNSLDFAKLQSFLRGMSSVGMGLVRRENPYHSSRGLNKTVLSCPLPKSPRFSPLLSFVSGKDLLEDERVTNSTRLLRINFFVSKENSGLSCFSVSCHVSVCGPSSYVKTVFQRRKETEEVERRPGLERLR